MKGRRGRTGGGAVEVEDDEEDWFELRNKETRQVVVVAVVKR